MSGNGHPTEYLSQLIDKYLSPHISSIPSYIKDTNHLIETMKNLELPPNSTIVSFDIKALYTNIPYAEGIEAVRLFVVEKTNE